MPSLSKTVLAHTFELDCDRYLRFKLASDEEVKALRLADFIADPRPGIHPQMVAGHQWETARYQDLVDLCPTDAVRYRLDTKDDKDLGRPAFVALKDLFEALAEPEPPSLLLEATFEVPDSFAPGLSDLYARHGLDPVKARPDILWIRPAGTGIPTIGGAAAPEFEIHVVDIKRAAEPSLKHFTEVTFYALALARALELRGLSDRYAVSAQGYIWPGNHDDGAFRALHAERLAENDPDPLSAALLQTLAPVPHEVYHVHVRRFFAERLPRVLAQDPLDAAWHVNPVCRGCEYVSFCRDQAGKDDHLCRIPWLSRGQAAALRRPDVGITTTQQLAEAITNQSPAWQRATEVNPTLRGEAALLLARASALSTGRPVAAEGRRWPLMPKWTNMSVYITIHADPGSGVTFAMGARVVYRRPDAPKVKIPDQRLFIVDRAEGMAPETEAESLSAFIEWVFNWLMEAHAYNRQVEPKAPKASAQVFVWEPGEIRQLRRMLGRHMNAPAMTDAIQLLLRLFPPDDVLPDPDAYKSQPYTVVKDAFRQLYGLPLAHDYTLLDTVDAFFPLKKKDGEFWKTLRSFGYDSPYSDQIPFERAYELWTGRVTLHHPRENGKPGAPYTREELITRLRNTVSDRLRVLEHVVDRLRFQAGDRLTLKKDGFCAAEYKPPRLPAAAARLLTFERLNTVVAELDNRHGRALPVEEREARFIAIRGILPADGPDAEAFLNTARASDPEHAAAMRVFTFSKDSRDARIKEGDFLLALSNEDMQADLDMKWWRLFNKTFAEAKPQDGGEFNENSLVRATLRRLLSVSLVRLDTMSDPPMLVLRPDDDSLFRFACHKPDDREAILDMSRPMVLDILYRDFHLGAMEEALKAAKPAA